MFVKRVSAIDETKLNADVAANASVSGYMETRLNAQAKLMVRLSSALKSEVGQ
jgi:hypothetical protein